MPTTETPQPFDFTDFETRFTHVVDFDPQNTVTILVDAILQNPDQAAALFTRAQHFIKHGTSRMHALPHIAGLRSMPSHRNRQAQVFPFQVIAELAKRIAVIGAKLGLDGEEIRALSEETAGAALKATTGQVSGIEQRE